MWPVSDLYLATLARSHSQSIYLEVLKDGLVVADLQSGVIVDPTTGLKTQSIGGSIQVDKTTIRRSGTISFVDVSGMQLPDDAGDLFAPFVTELRVWVVVNYWDGSGFEKVPIATLVITNLDNDYPQMTITGYDRMWTLGTFVSPLKIPKGSNIADALTSVLATNVPTSRFEINIPAGTVEEVTPNVLWYDVDTPVTDVAFKLTEMAGWDLCCDPMGRFVTTDQPSTDDQPVLTYRPGPFSMLANHPKRSVAAAGELYNAVVFTGEGGASTSIFRGYAEDDDPSSLSYVGRVGVRVLFASSPLITTQGQADRAARTRLNGILGISDTLTVPVIPNHALESGDVIHVVDSSQNLDQNVIVDSFPVPLRASDGVQELSCRSKVIR